MPIILHYYLSLPPTDLMSPFSLGFTQPLFADFVNRLPDPSTPLPPLTARATFRDPHRFSPSPRLRRGTGRWGNSTSQGGLPDTVPIKMGQSDHCFSTGPLRPDRQRELAALMGGEDAHFLMLTDIRRLLMPV